uniref:Neurotoxin ShK-like1 n=1 Tax=Nematostella vectensis TaxID=45351 RepID=SHKL1_NEMVE|nr:RecName: Full=Neurotoxin ShK-like1; Flags: Precursor [Nematostella vectensis]
MSRKLLAVLMVCTFFLIAASMGTNALPFHEGIERRAAKCVDKMPFVCMRKDIPAICKNRNHRSYAFIMDVCRKTCGQCT